MATAIAVADPIAAYLRRVEEVQRSTALSQEEAEAVVAADLDDEQISAVVNILMSSPLTTTQAIDAVKRSQMMMYHYGTARLVERPPARPTYTSSLLENFKGLKRHKRARPAPRKRGQQRAG